MRTETVDREIQTYSGTKAKAKVYRIYLDSTEDLATEVSGAIARSKDERGVGRYTDWHGVRSLEAALALLRDGWSDELPATLDAARSAVTTVQGEQHLTRYTSETAIRGKRANVARFMAGVPECMVTMRPREIVRTGRIVTLCASITYSSTLSPDKVIERGRIMTALAMVLADLGYGVEIWTDFTGANSHLAPNKAVSIRTLVKSAHDVVDPARILFMLAHPASARVLTFPFAYDARRKGGAAPGWIGSALGPICEPITDLPDGTIYLPAGYDGGSKSVAEQVTDRLRDLGIVKD